MSDNDCLNSVNIHRATVRDFAASGAASINMTLPTRNWRSCFGPFGIFPWDRLPVNAIGFDARPAADSGPHWQAATGLFSPKAGDRGAMILPNCGSAETSKFAAEEASL
jgi:hypothetical protein